MTTYVQGTQAAAGQPVTAGVVNLSSSSTAFVGAINVEAGTLAISGTGQVGGTGAITVYNGATLAVTDNSATPIANRLGGNRALTLDGGTFSYTANGTAASSETFGAFNFGTGASTILLTNTGAANSTVTFASITQNSGGSTLDIDYPVTGGSLGTRAEQTAS